MPTRYEDRDLQERIESVLTRIRDTIDVSRRIMAQTYHDASQHDRDLELEAEAAAVRADRASRR